jgi:glucose-1-phosphate thymidylyltransferase
MELGATIEAFRAQSSGARLLLKEVQDPQRFGVATLDGERIARIVEKPAHPESPFAITGIYCYDADVFEIVDTLVPSKRGELEITDVNNAYVRRGDLEWSMMEGYWTDAGTFESLKHANDLLAVDADARTS